ncbi:acyl carrier protein [Lacipirellula parvula]|uniref:acyl carrier protein n=1 Tax=Lacipirellula parvula TaxID=2650471 RepID=UPI001260B1B0|nr:acyl carrier protein [Lacipirellula parvula]
MLRQEVVTNQLDCPVCGAAAATLTADQCCGACDAILEWFQTRLTLIGYQPLSRVSLASSFAGDLTVDSLDLVEIVCDLEQDFDVAISGNDALRITTIGDAIACVRRNSTVMAPPDVALDSPRLGLRVAPAGLMVQLSKIFARSRRPR